MPHVSSQIRVGEFSTEILENRPNAAREKELPRLQTTRQHPMQPAGNEIPTLSLLITGPDKSRWDFGSSRHNRQHSNISEYCTSASTVDSVFELPSAGPFDTPLSAHSMFIAELEDTSIVATSPVVTSQQLTVMEHRTDRFKVPEISSRAVVAIESIFAIEQDNRLLYSRALAAEEEAKALKEENTSLQHCLHFCAQNHRPKTAPHLTITLPSTARVASDNSPRSSFNNTTEMSPGHKVRHRPSPLALSQPLNSPIRNDDFAPCPFAASPSPGRRVETQSNHQPVPQMQLQPNSNDLEISGPIPGSVFKQQVTYNGKPIAVRPQVKYISLAEAQRRQKPLPCILPITPSTVPGFVEMGSRVEVPAQGKQGKQLVAKQVLVGLFRRGKQPGNLTD